MITGSQLLTHIPGKLNEEADTESRKQETRTEWMINRKYFEKIIKSLNFKPTVDLFVTSLNTQLPHFISLRPDPEFKVVNAFTFSWENLSFYVFCDLFVSQWFLKRFGIIKQRVY